MSEPLRTLGRYALKRRLAAGGMGEVYLGEVQGAANFTKQVAIKRILPHLAANEAFVAKFIDEANVTVQLHHGNIVPVLELADEGGELFIVMEYLPGRDLKAVLHRLKAQRRSFPVDLALFVAGEICDGLDYAHRRTGVDGHPLHIVHRDVSPSNVMLGAAGEVKLVDFGIARARGSLHQSISGTLQGKFAYMSPEQAEGLHVDARSDIFSTGLVLYEMLTGARPLEGDSETETLRRVRQARIAPPSALRPDVPPEVDALVLKALAPAPEARHVTAAAMRREMSVVLAALHSPADASMLHRFLADVFPEGVVPQTADAGPLSMDDALKLQLGALTPSVDSMGSTRTATGPSAAVRKPATFSTDDAPLGPPRSAPPASAPALPVAEPSSLSAPPTFSPSGTQPAIVSPPVAPSVRPLIGRRVLAGLVGLVLATVALWAYLDRPVPASLTVVTVPPAPTALEVRVDGSPLQGAFVGAVGDQVEVCAEARDFERRCRGPIALRAGLNSLSIELQPRMVVFRFEAEPANTTVVVEGIKDPFPQGTSQNVVLGEAVTVVWQAPGHRTLEQKYDLFQLTERRLRARLEPDPAAIGPPSAAVSNAPRTSEPPAVPSNASRTNETVAARPRPVLLQSTPEGAEVLVDGKVVGRTPLELAAPRTSQLYRLRAPGYVEATLRLEPGAGSPPRVEMVQNAPGYLSVRVEPAAGTLLLDGRDTGKNVLRAHAIPAGTHTLQARFLDRPSPVRQIEIEPGKTLELPAIDLTAPEDRAADGVPHP